MPTPIDTYTLIQITDSHLFADQSTKLRGYCTHQHFADIITHILNSNVNPNGVLLTGDISHDETAQSYQLALTELKRFNCPVYWLHGNHDNETELSRIFSDCQQMIKLEKLSTPHWDLISINTCRIGTDSGYIEDDEYQRFLSKIAGAKNSNIAVVMHHHPIEVKTPLLDECMLQNNEQFLAIVKQNKKIKLLICGHVHGDYKVAYDDVVMEVCPATCFQWKKGTSIVDTEDRRGYKIFQFDPSSYTSSTIFI